MARRASLKRWLAVGAAALLSAPTACGGGSASGAAGSPDGGDDVAGTASHGADAADDVSREVAETVEPATADATADLPLADAAGTAPDAPADADDGATAPADVADDGPGPEDCPQLEQFTYDCDPNVPATCPDGICLFSLCLAPVSEDTPWEACGDGACDPCEARGTCPADCDEAPVLPAADFDNDTTITVHVHGFNNNSTADLAKEVYGAHKSCSGMLGALAGYGVERPCGNTPDGHTAPNQLASVEYYGDLPAPFYTPDDIAEIEQFPYAGGPLGLQRYGLVVAKFIRHKLDVSGATHVNMVCHSMGCLITRYLIENDLEGLASEGRFVRWHTSAGVLAGARLARLYDNPTVQSVGGLLPWNFDDFVMMHPDYVREHAAAWDHRLRAAHSPYLRRMLIHNMGGTKPELINLAGVPIQLLDANNPGSEPNDGIMFTLDTVFDQQDPAVGFVTPAGATLTPSWSYIFIDHQAVSETPSAEALAAASLFHRRKVRIVLEEVTLIDDLEADNPIELFSEGGTPPAELVSEVQVRYDPYLRDTFGKDVLIHHSLIEHRTPGVLRMEEGDTLRPDDVLFYAPVFDGMTALQLHLEILEVDLYPTGDVRELGLSGDPHDALATFRGAVPLEDGTIDVSSGKLRATLRVEVHTLY